MKCPKCGYNSFEIHDTCKKCANDLNSYKDIHGLKSIVLPLEIRTIMAEKLMAERLQNVPAVEVAAPADMFSFDVPEVETTAVAAPFPKDDPFNFGDEPADLSRDEGKFAFGNDQSSTQDKGEEDAFADLLETTPRNDSEQSATSQAAAASPPGGTELDNFTWDDTPDAPPGEAAKPAEDDFNSLFGDTDDSVKK